MEQLVEDYSMNNAPTYNTSKQMESTISHVADDATYNIYRSARI